MVTWTVFYLNFTDLDVVLLDGSSTDNYPAICDAYAHQGRAGAGVHK